MDLLMVVRLLRRRWLPLVLCIVAGIVGAVFVTARTETTYEASARLFVNLPVASGVQEALQGVQLSSQLLESYAAIATSRSTAVLISGQLEGRLTADDVRGRMRASARPNTLLLDVSARHGDPDVAQELANAGADAVIATIRDLESNKQNPVEARVIDKAPRPSRPISPQTFQNLVAGLGIGLAFGLAVALVLDSLTDGGERRDRAARDEEDRVSLATSIADMLSAPLAAVRGQTNDLAGEVRALREQVRASATEPEDNAVAPVRRSARRTAKRQTDGEGGS